ncbi:hypothetical protein LEMLEM_LOCUS21251 [Lemmus lemmus]
MASGSRPDKRRHLAGSETPTHSWPSLVAWSTGLNMTSGGYVTCHSSQDGPTRQQSPRTSPRHQTIAQMQRTTWTSGFIAAWGSIMDHRHQHGLRWNRGPQGSFKEPASFEYCRDPTCQRTEPKGT